MINEHANTSESAFATACNNNTGTSSHVYNDTAAIQYEILSTYTLTLCSTPRKSNLYIFDLSIRLQFYLYLHLIRLCTRVQCFSV